MIDREDVFKGTLDNFQVQHPLNLKKTYLIILEKNS